MKITEPKLKKASDSEIAWAFVLTFLDHKSCLAVKDRREWHPMLLEVLDKIQSLKLALATACRLGNIDQNTLEAMAYERVISQARK